MAFAPLAAEADLSARGVDISNSALVAIALDVASEAIRDAAGNPISEVTSTDVEFEGSCAKYLRLPGGPVSAVASVKINGVEVTDYVKVGSRLYRAEGWGASTYFGDGTPVQPYDPNYPSVITATYTHGYSEIPADVVDLVCQLAAYAINKAAEGYSAKDPNLAATAIDDFRESYFTAADATVSVMELPPRTRNALRARFGNGGFAQ